MSMRAPGAGHAAVAPPMRAEHELLQARLRARAIALCRSGGYQPFRGVPPNGCEVQWEAFITDAMAAMELEEAAMAALAIAAE